MVVKEIKEDLAGWGKIYSKIGRLYFKDVNSPQITQQIKTISKPSLGERAHIKKNNFKIYMEKLHPRDMAILKKTVTLKLISSALSILISIVLIWHKGRLGDQ